MSLKSFIYNKPTLVSKRLVIRPLNYGDVEDLREWISDNEIYRYWGKKISKAEKNPELLFQAKEKPTKSFHWGLVAKSNTKVIGEAYLYLIEKDCIGKIAIRISKKYQNMGIATEAINSIIDFSFKETELKRLWSDVDVRNLASARVLEKCGFTCEGKIRQGKMVSTICDYYIYGLLKQDLNL